MSEKSDFYKTDEIGVKCEKRYSYEYSMFWECNEGCKCQILEDDVVDLLNEQQTIINKLREENKKLKEINKDKEQDVLHLYKKNEKLKEIIKKGVNNE